MKGALASLALLVTAGCFMPAAVGTRMEQRTLDRIRGEVAAEWRRIDALHAGRGWTPVGSPNDGRLQERWDESDEVVYTLPASGTYLLLGLCSNECTDMDLVVVDGNRRRLGADTSPDDVPVVRFEGQAGQRVTAIVTIPACRRYPRRRGASSDPPWDCLYFMRLYRRA